MHGGHEAEGEDHPPTGLPPHVSQQVHLEVAQGEALLPYRQGCCQRERLRVSFSLTRRASGQQPAPSFRCVALWRTRPRARVCMLFGGRRRGSCICGPSPPARPHLSSAWTALQCEELGIMELWQQSALVLPAEMRPTWTAKHSRER